MRDLNTHCPFTPPATLEAWQTRAADLRLQLQVANGLHPAIELDAVAPEIYGKLEKEGYTIEKCVFESLPGYYVTGNLYRPSEIAAGAKLPGILCPHGHWTDARFYDASVAGARRDISIGAERFESAGRNPIQARCVQLARMGCIVFHWDMIGYCDSTQISFDRAHKFANQPRESEVADDGWLLFSPLAEGHLQSIMGLQTLATHRAVDMLLSLPEVDPARIAITGASGGGTQSFIGAATDERIQVAFPAVMVSTGMQGGCTCESCCLLRTGSGNVEMAALIAPRPLAMTAANDWTRTMPTDGFPQLQQLYKLFGAEAKVALFPAVHFDHNYNHVARTAMYGWMNDHFGLGFEKPVLETDFELTGRDDLSVWDAEHPQPAGGEAFERKLMKLWSEIVHTQLNGLLQGDQQQNERLAKIMHEGWRVTLGLTTDYAASARPAALAAATEGQAGVNVQLGENEPLSFAMAAEPQGLVENPRLAAAYTYGYNLPIFAKQAQELGLALFELASKNPDQTVKVDGAGVHAALAVAAVFCAEEFARDAAKPAPKFAVSIDPAGFRFAAAESIRDYRFLPGSLRYRDLPGLTARLQSPVTLPSDSEPASTDIAEFKRLMRM
ncbi:MAG: acetylxylan esterase [Pirellulaceae bacterium]